MKAGLSLMLFLLILGNASFAQYGPALQLTKKTDNVMSTTLKDKSIDTAEDLTQLFSAWNKFPDVEKVNQDYIMYYEDKLYGKIPVRVYIPKMYNKASRFPAVLLLHGAVQVSSFARAEKYAVGDSSSRTEADDDIFYNYLSKQGFIIIRPFADPSKKFNWVINQFNAPADRSKPIDQRFNQTYRALCEIVIDLKHMLNIDDSQVYAFGHSDGSDGAFQLSLTKPDLFAGFVIYNSTLTNILTTGEFLTNVRNRPLYIVHSDLDDIRPIEQVRPIIEQLKKYNVAISYKEYHGYHHFDKHLVLDLPSAGMFLSKSKRNPFQDSLYWESNNAMDNKCDWLKVTSFDLLLPKEAWHESFNVPSYNKREKIWTEDPYYNDTESYAIKATFKDNVFTVFTSRILEFEILISEKMVDVNRPVKIVLNGREISNKKISASKQFIIKSFEVNRDRDAVWCNVLKIKTK